MMPKVSSSLIGGHSGRNLTKSEADILYRASLDDDELFAELALEDEIRELLDDDEFRGQVRTRLAELANQAPTGWRAWMAKFDLVQIKWYHLLALSSGIFVGLLVFQGPEVLNRFPAFPGAPGIQVALAPGGGPPLNIAGIVPDQSPAEQRWQSESKQAPVALAEGAQLSLDRAGSELIYRIGDRQRIGFRVSSASHVILIEERSDGSAVRHYPNRIESALAVSANQLVLIPPSGQGDLAVDGPPGTRTLKLFVFPLTVDPLAEGADWTRLRETAKMRQLSFEVQP